MVRQVIHQIPLNQLLRSPSGAVARDMMRRGYKVQARARQLLGGGGPQNPKRINTGYLRSSISVRLIVRSHITVRIGTSLRYALWVHDGTGLYGPLRRRITPKNARALRFRVKGKSGYVFAKSVRGMKRNQFLKDALPAAG
jgi:hypothetical protein